MGAALDELSKRSQAGMDRSVSSFISKAATSAAEGGLLGGERIPSTYGVSGNIAGGTSIPSEPYKPNWTQPRNMPVAPPRPGVGAGGGADFISGRNGTFSTQRGNYPTVQNPTAVATTPQPVSNVIDGSAKRVTGYGQFMDDASGRLRGRAGIGGAAITAGLEGYDTYRDATTPGMNTLDKTARVAEGVGRGAGAIAGGALGATAGSVVPVVGTAIGGLVGGAAGYFAPDLVNKAVNYLAGTDTELASDKAARLRDAQVQPQAIQPQAVPPQPATAAAVPNDLRTAWANRDAPYAMDERSPDDPEPRFEDFEPGTAGARGIQKQINSGYTPGNDSGLIMASNGRATRINAPPPKADAQASKVDPVEATLMREMSSKDNSPIARQKRIEAATALANYRNQKEELGIKASTAKGAAAKVAADATKDANADERAQREAKRKTIEAMFPHPTEVGKTDGAAAADFTRRAESTINKRTNIYANTLKDKNATPEQKAEATRFLSTFAKPTKDGGFEPIGVEYLSEAGLREMRTLYDVAKRSGTLYDENATRAAKGGAFWGTAGAIAGGAAAGAAKGKRAGMRGAIVGGLVGAVGGAAEAASRRNFTEDDDLMRYRFRPEDPSKPQGYYVSDNGTRMHFRDLATKEGSNVILPDWLKSKDDTFITNPNVVDRRGISNKVNK